MHGDCQVCGKRPATIHLTELPTDGPRQEAHLCPQCVERLGLDLHRDPPSVHSILTKQSTSAQPPAAPTVPPPTGKTCPRCAFAFSDYAENNLFGCAECYDAFAEQVDALLRRYHGAVGHVGRIPGSESGVMPPVPTDLVMRRATLEARLRDAITAERYEEAAHLRDQIQHLAEPS
ncbi:excinuclease Uvr [Planctomycetota bacterium]|nr:excinuclease Uvr [Planctomycetota bacterium]